jgi:hypothetical protein
MNKAMARQSTKESMRYITLQNLVSQRESDLNLFIQTTTDPILQNNLDNYLKSLKKKAQ